MADAAAAFGLAAGILQFLDFGTGFAKKALRIYQAGKRGTDELLQLQSTIEDLQCVANSLGPTKNAGQVSLDDEASIWKLAKDCQQVATEVLSSLKKIRRPAASGKLDAVRTAFQITWNQDEIGSFRVRLSEFREQLNLHLLVSLRQYARKSAEQQEEVLKRLGVPNSDAGNTGQSAHRDGGIGSPVLRFVTAKLPPRSQAAATEDLKSRIIAEIYKITELNIQGDSAPPRELGHGREIAEKTFLSSLYYSAMEDRGEKIAAAHSKTFQWVFEGSRNGSAQHWSCLKTWLESNEQLYWITGKAGSGKSTLMKFICSPAERGSMETPQGTKARCEKHLRRWAGDNRLIIASFYFWNSGVRTQMSLNGLFRTLLFQILRQCPEMIPAISPGRWEALLLFNTDDREWSNSELLRLLRLVTRKSPENDKFCLFVDGLDEFGGDHGDLISLLQDLLLNGNVKVCVASRPDLTYDDIKAYVASHFNDSPGFVQLQIREPVYSSRLIENVVEKASGVFIWVYLVVSSLLTGLRHGDRISDLQRRLDMLPPDLEELYEIILKSIDPFYLENAAQLFTVIRSSPEPLSSLLLSFADDVNSESAPKLIIEPLSVEGLSVEGTAARQEAMRRRVMTWSMGFLEISARTESHEGGTIQYLHRTVKDYIETEQVQKLFGSVLMATFDPHLKLCYGNLAVLKCLSYKESYWPYVNRALYAAARVTASNYLAMVTILDELDRTATNMMKRQCVKDDSDRDNRDGAWTYDHPNKELLIDSGFGFSILSLAVRYGIVSYVDARVPQGSDCYVNRTTTHDLYRWPLLWDALLVQAFWEDVHGNIFPDVDTVSCLLRKGADPNAIPHGRTGSCWLRVLKHALASCGGTHQLTEPWASIVPVMVEAGADLNELHNEALPQMIESEKRMLVQELQKIRKVGPKRWVIPDIMPDASAFADKGHRKWTWLPRKSSRRR